MNFSHNRRVLLDVECIRVFIAIPTHNIERMMVEFVNVPIFPSLHVNIEFTFLDRSSQACLVDGNPVHNMEHVLRIDHIHYGTS